VVDQVKIDDRQHSVELLHNLLTCIVICPTSGRKTDFALLTRSFKNVFPSTVLGSGDNKLPSHILLNSFHDFQELAFVITRLADRKPIFVMADSGVLGAELRSACLVRIFAKHNSSF
jgi:hypothetical protein